MSRFDNLPEAVPDAAFQLIEAYKTDSSPKKVDLSPGFYRDDQGKPWILPSVQKTKQRLQNDSTMDHEHSPIIGHALFLDHARDILFNGSNKENERIASVQTIAGTGANHLGALVAIKARQPNAVWISDPSWINHQEIWKLADSQIQIRKYPYFDPKTFSINFDGLLSALRSDAQEGDVVILHACAHNPTGLDLSKTQWRAIAEVCSERGLTPFFDVAYQGFATGDLDEDAWAIRYFMHNTSLEILVAQSFSKNFGLYGERIGALHVICSSSDSRSKVLGVMSQITRAELTTCPINGARIVATVLNDATLRKQWCRDLVQMSDRMKSMRKSLVGVLKSRQTPGSWDHILTDIGMFSMTGLGPEQVHALRETYAVYMLPSGRISLTGCTYVEFLLGSEQAYKWIVNEHNVDYVAESFHQVITKRSHQEHYAY